MTYGSFDVRGIQFGTQQQSQQGLGPFSIPFGSAIETVTVSVLTTSTAVAVPTGANGFFCIPPLGNVTTLSYLSNSGDSTGTYVNPGLPWYLQFDTVTPHVPANIYFKAGSTLAVVVQFV